MQAGVLVFEAAGASVEGESAPLWRLDLPADAAEAERMLAAGEAALVAGRLALEQAAGRMDDLAASGRLAAVSSFAAESVSPEDELRLRETLERLWRTVSHYAWVETRAGGELVGRTGVGWTGDVATVLREPVEPGRADLHRRAVALAVASRDAWVRAVAVALEGALKLSVLLSVPGGAVLALPVAWKYMSAVVDRLDAMLP